MADLAAELERADGMKRRGIVLASLMRLKQICNHPSQWLATLVERGRQRQAAHCAKSRGHRAKQISAVFRNPR